MSEDLVPVELAQLGDLVDVVQSGRSALLGGHLHVDALRPRELKTVCTNGTGGLRGPVWALVVANTWCWFEAQRTRLDPWIFDPTDPETERAARLTMSGVDVLCRGLVIAYHTVVACTDGAPSRSPAMGKVGGRVRFGRFEAYARECPGVLPLLGELREKQDPSDPRPVRVWVQPRVARACELAAILASCGAAGPEGGYHVLRAEVARSRALARAAVWP